MPTDTIAVTLGSGAVIAAFLQFLKAVIERVGLKPGDPLHDPSIQLCAGLVGMGGFVLHAALLGPLTGPIVWDNGGQGILAGLSSIVTYHILTGSTPTIPIIPPAPQPPAAVNVPQLPPATWNSEQATITIPAPPVKKQAPAPVPPTPPQV